MAIAPRKAPYKIVLDRKTFNNRMKEIEEVNTARKHCGLKKLKHGDKKCLNCDRTFYSFDHVNERICGQCK
tara:strand:- start:1471 stop:1683 length:213 start_codon:yes stop_codon:yes gene_type:complete